MVDFDHQLAKSGECLFAITRSVDTAVLSGVNRCCRLVFPEDWVRGRTLSPCCASRDECDTANRGRQTPSTTVNSAEKSRALN